MYTEVQRLVYNKAFHLDVRVLHRVMVFILKISEVLLLLAMLHPELKSGQQVTDQLFDLKKRAFRETCPMM